MLAIIWNCTVNAGVRSAADGASRRPNEMACNSMILRRRL